MVDKKSCPHVSLEFELGGKLLRCRACGQQYQALTESRTGSPFLFPDQTYYNIHILHHDRRDRVANTGS